MNNGKGSFIFKNHTWDPATGQATFNYQIQHKDEEFNFTETLEFPIPYKDEIPQKLLKNLLDNLLLILGISYYKLFLPKEIKIENFSLSKEQSEFWNTIYTKGLGEFFYRNQIDFHGLISFPYSDVPVSPSVAFPRTERSLLGIGGGKESIVAAELLKASNKPFANYILKPSQLQKEVVETIGGNTVAITRKIDPKLFELNKREDVFNGHIPISGVYAFVGLFAAALYDYRYVIIANEQTSSYGNIIYKDEEINHQWSKSHEFEKLLQNYLVKFISGDIHYFSILRQLTEIEIVKQFSKYPKYFSVFSSCNRNFQIYGQASKKWCGECAKCIFTFIMLSAFLTKQELTSIFGGNLYKKESLLPTFKELLGVSGIKPFDCVGTPEEVKVAFYMAQQKGEFEADIAMDFFKNEVLSKMSDIEKLKKEVFTVSNIQSIPEEFEDVIKYEN